VRILESDPGKPNAWNRIVAHSGDWYLLFTDGDAFLPNGAAEKMLQALSKIQMPASQQAISSILSRRMNLSAKHSSEANSTGYFQCRMSGAQTIWSRQMNCSCWQSPSAYT